MRYMGRRADEHLPQVGPSRRKQEVLYMITVGLTGREATRK
jgi:hypothetical protein